MFENPSEQLVQIQFSDHNTFFRANVFHNIMIFVRVYMKIKSNDSLNVMFRHPVSFWIIIIGRKWAQSAMLNLGTWGWMGKPHGLCYSSIEAFINRTFTIRQSHSHNF